MDIKEPWTVVLAAQQVESQVKKINKYQMLFFILLAGLAVFRLFYISTVNLCYDEAYNWDWSQQLALSY